MKVGTILIFCCVLFGAALFPAPTQSSNNAIFSQRINGTFVAISGRSAGRTGQFSLIVNNYTAPNQVRLLNEALGRGGQDALLDELNWARASAFLRMQSSPNHGATEAQG